MALEPPRDVDAVSPRPLANARALISLPGLCDVVVESLRCLATKVLLAVKKKEDTTYLVRLI